MNLQIEDAVIGIKKSMDFRYMKLLRMALSILSFWPKKEMGEDPRFERLVTLYLSVLQICGGTSVVVYMVLHRKELTFLDFGHTYIMTCITVLTLSRTISMPLNPRYRKLLTKFVKEIHMFNHRNTSEYSMKVHRQVHSKSHKFTVTLFLETVVGMILFNTAAFVSNISNGKLAQKELVNTTYMLPVYFASPFDDKTKRSTYLWMSLYIWYISYIIASTICMVDLILIIIVFHLSGHFKVLRHDLITFMRPKNETLSNLMYSKEEMKVVADRLKQCIEYHHYIIKFTDEMSETFGPMLLVYYIFHQLSCCLLLLECSPMTAEAIIQYAPLTLVIFQQLIQLSIVFEIIGTESEKLKDAVYFIPWEYMDTANRKTVRFFMMKTQKTVHVKAMGIAEVGVQSMAVIIKTAVSYFTFLKTVAD